MELETKSLPQHVPLHLHTEYSLLDGASRIKDLVQKAKLNNIPALSITDHGVMYGGLELYRTCKAEGIKPIIGCEVYTVNGDHTDKSVRSPLYHLILLAKNDEGYINLSKIASESSLNGFYYKPRISKDFLKKHNKGLIAMTACLGGEVPNNLLGNNYDRAREVAEFYKSLYGDDFYLEIQDHGYQEEKFVNSQMLKLAKDLNLKLTATNDSHYTNREDAIAQDAMLCLQTNKSVKEYPRMRFTGTEYLKNGSEMLRLFNGQIDEEEIRKAVLISPLEITEKIEDYKILSENFIRLPEFPLPSGYTKESYLSELVWKGAKERYGEITAQVEERVKIELDVIFNQGFANYFLIVWDFIKYAKDHKIAVGPGRGSAAGSIVAFSLRITDIDPIRYNLLFERFLNPERKSLPDIDTDFCIERRDEILEYVKDKYGSDRVSQIITFNKLASRAVLKDIARVLNYPYSESEKIAKLIPVVRGKPRELEWMKENHEEFKGLYIENQDVKEIIDLAEKLEGINKTFGVHAAGVVICDGPLNEIVPISKNNEGSIITQYSMDDLAYLGLLKMDFLGLRNLTMINKAIDIVGKTRAINIDITNIPTDDEKVFKMISSGDLAGIFQLETSSGMKQVARDMKPSTLEDLSALIALYRPGPLDTGMIDDFIARKNGKKEIRYLIPELEPILKDTYGTIVYQEQIMQIAQRLANFTLGEADLLRRAMGKKKPQEMAKYKDKFIEGFKNNNYSLKVAEELFDMMVSFAEYCFNKSHSAAYGLITYQTAYLKANYPIEYLTALLSSVLDDQDKIKYYMAECKRIGVKILPPDINLSGMNFTADLATNSIRFGLGAIKNVGIPAVNEIIRARSESGVFKSLTEFCGRIDLKVANKKTLESLIKCGAMDSLKQSRKSMIESLENTVSNAQRQKEILASGQLNLFGESGLLPESKENLDNKSTKIEDEFTIKELYLMEKELTGFYISSHPLDSIPETLLKATSCNLSELNEVPDGAEILFISIISDATKRLTKTNKLIAIVQLEDLLGKSEAIMFSDQLTENEHLLVPENIVAILGKVQHKSEGDTSIQIKSMQKVDDMEILSIELDEKIASDAEVFTNIHYLRSLLQREKPCPFYPIVLTAFKNGKKNSYILDKRFWVKPNDLIINDISKLSAGIKVSRIKPFDNNSSGTVLIKDSSNERTLSMSKV